MPLSFTSPSKVQAGHNLDEQVNDIHFPALHQKPSYASLHSVLKQLEYRPMPWDHMPTTPALLQEDTKVVSQYLTGLVKSDLQWLSNDVTEEEALNRKENLWQLAARRLAERCGRSAMPEMMRTWTITQTASTPGLDIALCEPPLTSDHLGLKTWGTAFALAKRLEDIGAKYLRKVLFSDSKQSSELRILELGSGTGLLGITAAMLWDGEFILTDLPEILPNLEANVRRNEDRLKASSIKTQILDWNDVKDPSLGQFDLILVADPLYDEAHPQLVAKAISNYLKPSSSSRVITAVPLRDEATRKLKETFNSMMLGYDCEICAQGHEPCYDDWEADFRDGSEVVKCWWSISRFIT